MNKPIEDIVTQHSTQPSKIVALSPIIEKIIVAIENEDNIGLSDILEYELRHFDKRTEKS